MSHPNKLLNDMHYIYIFFFQVQICLLF